LAVQLTVVVPNLKVEPDSGVQLTLGLGSTASEAVGLV
jgi:homoserine kinase